MPEEEKSSSVEKAQAEEKAGWKTKAAMGFRVVMLAAAAYGFYLGVENLIELQKQYDSYKEYFKDKGEFEQSEESVIKIMGLVASDLFSLSNCARSTFIDCKNMFLVKTILTPLYYNTNMTYARQMNPSDLGLTDDFFKKGQALIDSYNAANKA